MCAAGFYGPTTTGPASNAALQGVAVVNMAAGSKMERLGFNAANDGGRASYVFSTSNCSAADNGAQVQPSAGTGCWIADLAGVQATPMLWGASRAAHSAADMLRPAFEMQYSPRLTDAV